MGKSTRDEIEDLAPSGKLVYKVLEYEGALTQKQIVEESNLSARTVRAALSDLEEIDVVTEELYLQDARQDLYTLTEEAPTTSGSERTESRTPGKEPVETTSAN